MKVVNNISIHQKGFTLIELMIAITLGLLISAAALMIFLSSQRSLAMQGGLGEIQQNVTFGLSSVTHDLRHISLQTNNQAIGRNEVGSGIIFSDANKMARISDAITPELATRANFSATPMNVNSDQLTIQLTAYVPMISCEGEEVTQNSVIVQRYFIGAMPNTDGRFALFCDAAVYGGSGTGRLNVGAVPIIPDAESFKVSVATQTRRGTNTFTRYRTLADYIASGGANEYIAALEVGVVMRSSNNVHSDSNINGATTYTIAGQDVQLTNPADGNRHLRVPYSQVVAIRNSSTISGI